ncbi:CPBP family intramembrane metalloprotease [Ktedonosporobacter rubrisoli]|uniref:CPBP family intramembrane metalloprotease n=2 Tax=Ktedonosporobacter rubrisoli TaxID=2509675 RepID=A0A4P6K6Q8_KTERU|nr:CPBP family intramembrane metalloprotease [Ktedonosporobacter rubrisoli]
MPPVPPNHSQDSVNTGEALVRPAPNAVSRPGWPEIIVGLLVLVVVGYGVGSQLGRLGLNPIVYGLIFTALSGVAGIAGFVAAALLRIRSLSAFGVRRVPWRWLLIGIGAGLLAFVLKILVTMAYVRITNDTNNIQNVYAQGGSGGVLSLVLATVFLALLTPLGEELLFRGVITTALLRYGPVIGVVGSAVIFGLAHGINIVLPTALVVGLVNAELRRRSGSVWPGVIAHAVVNLPTVAVMVAAGIH